ncbi:hypothetical protein T492DRAFT_839758 [Pavlovales sp. CCMP2436]|nr:hypothetical protein T492DRAFT_839758 [Pavlovales sp. CCMP2436]
MGAGNGVKGGGDDAPASADEKDAMAEAAGGAAESDAPAAAAAAVVALVRAVAAKEEGKEEGKEEEGAEEAEAKAAPQRFALGGLLGASGSAASRREEEGGQRGFSAGGSAVSRRPTLQAALALLREARSLPVALPEVDAVQLVTPTKGGGGGMFCFLFRKWGEGWWG